MKKIVLVFTLAAFIGVTLSCGMHTIKKIRIREPGDWAGNKSNVLTVYTHSKKLFMFDEKKPARIKGTRIVGDALDKERGKTSVSIPLSDAKIIWTKKFDPDSIFMVPLAVLGVACSPFIVIGLVSSVFSI